MTATPPDQPAPALVRSHRAPPGPAQRMGGRARVGTLLIAALAVGGVLANWRPTNGASAEERERPYVHTGEVGEAVSARAFDATVVSVRGVAKIRAEDGRMHDTGGVWILVRVRITATSEAASLGYAAVRDERERTYLATTRMEQPLTDRSRFQPGIPVEGEIVFEVPRDAATALAIRLASQAFDLRMDAMAEVALPRVDSATVDKWATDTTPATVDDEKVVS